MNQKIYNNICKKNKQMFEKKNSITSFDSKDKLTLNDICNIFLEIKREYQ